MGHRNHLHRPVLQVLLRLLTAAKSLSGRGKQVQLNRSFSNASAPLILVTIVWVCAAPVFPLNPALVILFKPGAWNASTLKNPASVGLHLFGHVDVDVNRQGNQVLFVVVLLVAVDVMDFPARCLEAVPLVWLLVSPASVAHDSQITIRRVVTNSRYALRVST